MDMRVGDDETGAGCAVDQGRDDGDVVFGLDTVEPIVGGAEGGPAVTCLGKFDEVVLDEGVPAKDTY